MTEKNRRTPPPPDQFDKAHAETWKRVWAVVKGDPPATTVENYCIELHRWRAAEDWLRDNGPEIYVRDDKGNVKNVIRAPMLQISRDSAKSVRELAQALHLRGVIA